MAKMRNKILTILVLFLISILSLKTMVLAESDDKVITKGVYIDSIHIGGMTAKQAKQAVQEYVDNLRSKKVTIHIDDNVETVSLADFGYDYIKNTYIEDALNIGKNGNLIKRYKELKDVEEANLVYNIQFQLDDEKVKEFVAEKCSAYNIPAVNATFKRDKDAFKYTNHVIGRKLNETETFNIIKNAITTDWNQEDVVLNAVVEDDVPLYTRDIVEKCNKILGTFTTTYDSSTEDRAKNLGNGARLINNTILYPGDVFSAYKLLTPFTEANGYYSAGAYNNGKIVDSIGGGACQVTTTLYNAAIYAELEIVERQPHSMTISYTDLSRDAAIAGTWKDLKFKNSMDTPILIEASTVDRTITFNIWGYETRDKARRIDFETVVLNEKQPGPDVIEEDPTKPVTYKKTTQSAHIGYTAELYKVVYENNVEVSRTRINKSVYNPSPRYITVGTMEIPPEEINTNPNEIIPSSENPLIEDTIEDAPAGDIQEDNNTTDENNQNDI